MDPMCFIRRVVYWISVIVVTVTVIGHHIERWENNSQFCHGYIAIHQHNRVNKLQRPISYVLVTTSSNLPLHYQSKDGIEKDEILDDDLKTTLRQETVKQLQKQSSTVTATDRQSVGNSPSSYFGKRSESPNIRKNSTGNYKNYQSTKPPAPRPPRMTKSPDLVEDELSRALDALKLAVQQQKAAVYAKSQEKNRHNHHTDHDDIAIQLVLFPTIRECNAALAAFGDTNELLRALQVFGKMRKAVTLYRTLQQYLILMDNHNDTINDDKAPRQHRITSKHLLPPIPAPTVVTYSTLMSRFVKADKPVVALRLWDLMIQGSSGNSGSNVHSEPLVIDVKAANILMNCYAKRADVRSAQQLLESMKMTTRYSQTGSNTTQPSEATTARAAPVGQSKGKPSIRMPAPNSITFNTFLSACHKSGDLDAAMAAVNDMRQLRLPMDALTYTTLIATVARKRSTIAGLYDPTPAFQFLQDMQASGISPNGMTYSALIDACGRCRRSDLALQGLRIMLRQKQDDSILLARMKNIDSNQTKNFTLSGEVGAWTAAINACGKAGRLDTAIRLFYTMPNFGLKPNTITCGSITDSLLRAGRTADTLDILRYMKNEGIQPSEVMYTSLMSRAEKLVELERQLDRRDRPLHPPDREMHNFHSEGRSTLESTKAIEVYTALMDSLINTKGSRAEQSPRVPNSKTFLLLKVFLVFQEMKTAGVNIDVPCYNTLLRACAQVGDVNRAQYVIRTMQREELDPNDTSWRLLLRSAMFTDGNIGGDKLNAIRSRIQAVENIWKQGLSYREGRSKRIDDTAVTNQWNPSVDTFVTLISVYLREADVLSMSHRNFSTHESERQILRKQYLERVVELYDNILLSRNDDGMGMNRISIDQLLNSQRAMMAILQAIVYLEDVVQYDNEFDMNEPINRGIKSKHALNIRQRRLRSMATSILQLECFSNDRNDENNHTAMKMSPSARQVLRKSRLWLEEAIVQ